MLFSEADRRDYLCAVRSKNRECTATTAALIFCAINRTNCASSILFFLFFPFSPSSDSLYVCSACTGIKEVTYPLLSLILPDADCEKITAALLKSRTGEFDLESILFLKLRGLGELKKCFY